MSNIPAGVPIVAWSQKRVVDLAKELGRLLATLPEHGVQRFDSTTKVRATSGARKRRAVLADLQTRIDTYFGTTQEQ